MPEDKGPVQEPIVDDPAPQEDVRTEAPQWHRYTWLGGFLAVLLILAGVISYLQWGSVGQQSDAPLKIGVIRYVRQISAVEDGFYKKMEELGYIEGDTVEYVIAPFADSPAEVPDLAKDVIGQDVDLIYANTDVAARGTQQALKEMGREDIPMVFTHANAADETGLVSNLQSTGENYTGVVVDFVEMTEKKLEFLQHIDPNIKKIGIIDAQQLDSASALLIKELPRAVQKFDMELARFKIVGNAGPDADREIDELIANLTPGDMDALFYMPGPVSNKPPTPQKLFRAARDLKIPSVGIISAHVIEHGALFSYSHDLIAMGEQTAIIVDKVLRGTHPSDIPVEYPKENQLTVHLGVAEEIGVTIPDSMLVIADQKIK